MQADLKVLWAMPIMQLCLLLFFTFDAWLHFWMDWGLLILCLATGGAALSKAILAWLDHMLLMKRACVIDSLIRQISFSIFLILQEEA